MNRSMLVSIFCVLLLIPYRVVSQGGGLLASYPFNGNADDESGNGFHGTVSGALLTEDRFGNPDHAYVFDGVDDYIAIPTLYSVSPDRFTAVAWFSAPDSNLSDKVFYHGDNGEFQLFVTGDTAWGGVHLGTSVFDPWFYVRGGVTNDEWHMMAVIWIQDESLRLYVDGVLADSVDVSANALLDPGSGYPASVGSYGQTRGNFYTGSVDDILIYDRALSAGEIDSIYSVSVTSVGPLPAGSPDDFRLSQNYPNPFNPVTVIRYTLPETADVTLKVFDLLGREVAVLLDQRQEAGSQEVRWDAGSMASGFYLYRIEATGTTTRRSFIASRSMLLVR